MKKSTSEDTSSRHPLAYCDTEGAAVCDVTNTTGQIPNVRSKITNEMKKAKENTEVAVKSSRALVDRRKQERREKIKSTVKRFMLNQSDEVGYFKPKTWAFWRGIIMYFFIFSIVGHWMELPYCHFMDIAFGIVEEDYAAKLDPWYIPYWVYGVGTAIITLIMLPLKVNIVKRRKTLIGAAIEFLLIAILLCAAMETVIGLLINQPDHLGEYPFWDNSQLPLNILGQGWLVNDIGLGFVSLLYVWVIFPFLQKVMDMLSHKHANMIFVVVMVLMVIVCVLSYAGR